MKKKNFRLIVVNEKKYCWKFKGKIDIRPKSNIRNQLLVDFGWYDVWLNVNDVEDKPKDFEPKRVTPLFVRMAIEFALENKWDFDQMNKQIIIEYKNKTFTRL